MKLSVGFKKWNHKAFKRIMIKRASEGRRNPTPAEARLWEMLKKKGLGVRFRRQQPFHNQYILDFYCSEKRLVVEVDGGYHFTRKKYDQKRDKYLKKHGLNTLRFSNDDVFLNLPTVMAIIRQRVSS